MVLSYLGMEVSESSLRTMLETDDIGTPVDKISEPEKSLDIKILATNMSLSTLKTHLDQKTPAIAFLYTEPLPYWQAKTAHAVVVVGYENGDILVNDPMFKTTPKRVQEKRFLESWQFFANFGVTVENVS
jgi:ABC-type bacteriocin/lantibiotic exporter with double-glycine peptidase domain